MARTGRFKELWSSAPAEDVRQVNAGGASHHYAIRCVGLHPPSLSLLAIAAFALIPWTILLAVTLPMQHQVTQWRAAWVGFDALLTAAFLTTLILGRHHHPTVVMARLFTAVLLVCDAWFDIALELGTPDVWWSIASAVTVELPLAAYLIRRSYRVISVAPWASVVGADRTNED